MGHLMNSEWCKELPNGVSDVFDIESLTIPFVFSFVMIYTLVVI